MDLILHHYDASPFSEKVRIVFGMTGQAWSSVITPNMMPKPDLMPLTGGYRKTPVMQIGADIYCDTQLIIRELERRYPEIPLVRDGGLSYGLGFWTDRPFFQATVPIIFGEIGPMVPEAFKKDREKMFPDRPFDYTQMKAASPMFRDQWRAHLAMIGETLANGKPYLGGDTPSVADAHCFMGIVKFRFAGDAQGAKDALNVCESNDPPAEVAGFVDSIRAEVDAALGE